MMNKAKYLIVFALLWLFSCGEEPKQPVSIPKNEMKSSMEKANRYLLN